MKVAIWGSYEHGNYGDDLMAVFYGLTAKEFSSNVFIYRLDEKIAKDFDLHSTNNLNDLLMDNPLLIVGGGGMVIDIPLKKWLSPRLRNFELDYRRLTKSLEKYIVSNILALSIGGSGLGLKTNLGIWRKNFFKNKVSLTTLRNIEDEPLLNSLGANYRTIPDVVLSTDYFFPKKDTNSQTKIIGVNLDKKNKKEIQEIRNLISDNYTIKYFKTHLSSDISSYEYEPDNLKKNEKVIEYSDLKTFIHEVTTLDILFTSKLHVGVTALSYKIPFISVAAKSKTRSFLRSINSPQAYTISVKDALNKFIEDSESCKDLYDWETLKEHKKNSFEHIDILKDALNSKNTSSS